MHTISDENVALEKGASELHIVLTASRVCRIYASCRRTC